MAETIVYSNIGDIHIGWRFIKVITKSFPSLDHQHSKISQSNPIIITSDTKMANQPLVRLITDVKNESNKEDKISVTV